MGERSFGAGWWRASLGVGRWAARPVAGTFGLLGALSLSGCATFGSTEMTEESALSDARDDVDVSVDALALQREQGWDVGQPGATLAFPDSSQEDISGQQGWRQAMDGLAGTLAPASAALQPFYVPTLFQSLMGASGQRLRAVMRPIHTAEMDADFARGVALRAQFGAVAWPKDTALVVDAPGPRAIAVAAALADRFAPVFTFGNWPHPLGVVPAHQTLAAALYYLPAFGAAQALRASDAPPLFVLDANRLAPYRDADKQFDNRYFVRLPSAEQLTALGIKHVLYVSADGNQELDDLNQAFVELCGKGVDVKLLALGDFVPVDGGDALAAAAVEEDPEETPFYYGVGWPGWHVGVIGLWPLYCYREAWWDRGALWADYPIYRPVPRTRGAVIVGPPPGRRPAPTSRAVAWVATPRATVFGNAAVAQRTVLPSGSWASHAVIGQVTVRASRSDGHVTGVRAGGAGSFGSSGGGAAHAGGFGVGGRSGVVNSAGGFHAGGGGHWGGGAARSGSIGRAGGFGGGGFGGG